MSVNRRAFLLGTLALAPWAATAARAQQPSPSEHPLYGGSMSIRDESLIPPPESPIDFPVQVVDKRKIPAKFQRQMVPYQGMQQVGSIVVDPGNRFLYHILEGGMATRYGVGVGRAGFAWAGEAVVGMKRRWPRWLPPEEMVVRDAKAAEWVNGMPGGPENPLGARALYLHANGEDTLYRIHGTNDPSSIGKAMSSGCIRMLNEDVADLYDKVPVGTRVLVLGSSI